MLTDSGNILAQNKNLCQGLVVTVRKWTHAKALRLPPRPPSIPPVDRTGGRLGSPPPFCLRGRVREGALWLLSQTRNWTRINAHSHGFCSVSAFLFVRGNPCPISGYRRQQAMRGQYMLANGMRPMCDVQLQRFEPLVNTSFVARWPGMNPRPGTQNAFKHVTPNTRPDAEHSRNSSIRVIRDQGPRLAGCSLR